ncbi:Helitron helicase-like protein [Phytophthora palmivora]|uniref:Helitron helicase-like protein n=1 Tax=Phytophthora palmivora TaxID=4796 RepID=A0A2P4XAD1_9STRA|nr:Helitron helicase-like protein [Phytophthora palmivora]
MGMTDGLDPAILEKIDQVMTAHNGYTQQFLNACRLLIDRAGPSYQASMEQFARQLVAGEARPGDNHVLRLRPPASIACGTERKSGYPQCTHCIRSGIIIDRAAAEHRDIILNTHQGGFKRFYETSESYDPLQHPLLPYGGPGWTYDLPYMGNPVDSNGKPLTMSLREYESYVLHDRTASNSLILRGGRLTQQYCAKCEQERLRFIEKNQLQYRLETLQGLTDVLWNESVDEVEQRGSTATTRRSRDTGVDSTKPEAENIGRKVIIHPTITGGSPYMYQRFLDAMAIVRETGAPNQFITMTCNPNWPEIKENLRPERRNLTDRTLLRKLKTLNKDLDQGLLGIVVARVLVEYQKSGLPHAHILLIMRPEDKPVTAEDVDRLRRRDIKFRTNSANCSLHF